MELISIFQNFWKWRKCFHSLLSPLPPLATTYRPLVTLWRAPATGWSPPPCDFLPPSNGRTCDLHTTLQLAPPTTISGNSPNICFCFQFQNICEYFKKKIKKKCCFLFYMNREEESDSVMKRHVTIILIFMKSTRFQRSIEPVVYPVLHTRAFEYDLIESSMIKKKT